MSKRRSPSSNAAPSPPRLHSLQVGDIGWVAHRQGLLYARPDVLTAARHIYAGAGFVLTREERHHSFGKDMVGQHWLLDLRPV